MAREMMGYGTGRRKTSTARVRLYPGTGQITVNGRPCAQYFCRAALERVVSQPLVLAQVESRYDVVALIDGGGLAGQAGALRHGIARALCEVDPNVRPPLKKAGFLTRDPRMVERKKYGQPGARKRFQFSKR